MSWCRSANGCERRPCDAGCEPVLHYNPYTPCQEPCPEPPLVFKAAVVANTTLAANAPALVSFPVAVLSNPNYSILTSTFTAPSAGRYAFTASVTWSTPYASTMFTLTLQLNGANTSFAASTTSGAPGVYVTTVSGILPVSAGAVVNAVAQSTQNVSILGSNPYPSPLSIFQGQLVCYGGVCGSQ